MGGRRVVGVSDGQRSRSDRRGRAESHVGGSALPGPATSLCRWRCEVERLADKPSIVSIACTGRGSLKNQLTRPSAQSIMTSRGRSARYMAVVHHHIGSPKKSTMAQNEMIT